MGELFHIDRYGLPTLCKSPSNCIYNERGHFNSYKKANKEAERLKKEFEDGYSTDKNVAKSLKSYYLDYFAVSEFLYNKQISSVEDFDLIIISWMERKHIKEQMMKNQIGRAKFTPGEVIKVIEQEMIRKKGKSLELEKTHLEPIPKDKWEPEMIRQFSHYNDKRNDLALKLGYDSLEIISLPMYARENLEKEGLLSTAANMNEVIYRVTPQYSYKGDIIAYNHSIGKETSVFDIYEIAGAIEEITLYDVTYAENPNSIFRRIWESTPPEERPSSYEQALERFISSQFFKGIQGVDVPRAFVNHSPLVAQEVRNYFINYRRIMLVMKDKLSESNLDHYSKNVLFYDKQKTDDEEWIIN